MSASASLDVISSALVGLVPEVAIAIEGDWTTSHRRTYAGENQEGSGIGPFADVVDMRWRGRLECSTPITGIAFLSTRRETYWVKSGRPMAEPPVEISMHARANYLDGRATFSSSLMGGVLPGVPVPFAGNIEACCKLGHPRFVTGRAHVVATVGDVVFALILLPRSVIKMGRKNLWHLRDELAASLPEGARLVLTRGRTGVLDAGEQTRRRKNTV
jgi:hypothetical protein